VERDKTVRRGDSYFQRVIGWALTNTYLLRAKPSDHFDRRRAVERARRAARRDRRWAGDWLGRRRF
jgi:hypothetical protein